MHTQCLIFSFVTGNYSAYLGCSDTCVVALLNLEDFFVILQDSQVWIFSSDGGDSGDMLTTLFRQVGDCSCTEAMMRVCWWCPCWICFAIVTKHPKQSQCFLLTPCTVTFSHVLHQRLSVLSRIWTTDNCQCQFVVNTEFFLSVIKDLAGTR